MKQSLIKAINVLAEQSKNGYNKSCNEALA